MARWEGFRQRPGCGFDLATDEGERSCSPCEDPMTCEQGVEPRAHVENLRTWVRINSP